MDPYTPEPAAESEPMFNIPPPPGVAVSPAPSGMGAYVPQQPAQAVAAPQPPVAGTKPNFVVLGLVATAGVFLGYLVHKEVSNRR